MGSIRLKLLISKSKAMKILSKISGIAIFGLLMSIPNSAHGLALTILNNSFESPILNAVNSNSSPAGFFTTALGNPDFLAIQGFNVTGTGNNKGGTYAPVAAVFPSLPNGNQVAYATVGEISQILSSFIQADTIYTLDVFVGRRFDLNLSTNYSINLFAFNGSTPTLLATLANPFTTSNLPAGTFGLASLTYTSPSSLGALAGQNLGIALASNSVDFDQAIFDNVTLDATPVPFEFEATTGVLLIGGYFVGKRYLKKRSNPKI